MFYPKTTAIWGVVYCLGVILFAIGYHKSATWRLLGLPLVLLTRFGLPIFTIVSLSKLAAIKIPVIVPSKA